MDSEDRQVYSPPCLLVQNSQSEDLPYADPLCLRFLNKDIKGTAELLRLTKQDVIKTRCEPADLKAISALSGSRGNGGGGNDSKSSAQGNNNTTSSNQRGQHRQAQTSSTRGGGGGGVGGGDDSKSSAQGNNNTTSSNQRGQHRQAQTSSTRGGGGGGVGGGDDSKSSAQGNNNTTSINQRGQHRQAQTSSTRGGGGGGVGGGDDGNDSSSQDNREPDVCHDDTTHSENSSSLSSVPDLVPVGTNKQSSATTVALSGGGGAHEDSDSNPSLKLNTSSSSSSSSAERTHLSQASTALADEVYQSRVESSDEGMIPMLKKKSSSSSSSVCKSRSDTSSSIYPASNTSSLASSLSSDASPGVPAAVHPHALESLKEEKDEDINICSQDLFADAKEDSQFSSQEVSRINVCTPQDRSTPVDNQQKPSKTHGLELYKQVLTRTSTPLGIQELHTPPSHDGFNCLQFSGTSTSCPTSVSPDSFSGAAPMMIPSSPTAIKYTCTYVSTAGSSASSEIINPSPNSFQCRATTISSTPEESEATTHSSGKLSAEHTTSLEKDDEEFVGLPRWQQDLLAKQRVEEYVSIASTPSDTSSSPSGETGNQKEPTQEQLPWQSAILDSSKSEKPAVKHVTFLMDRSQSDSFADSKSTKNFAASEDNDASLSPSSLVIDDQEGLAKFIIPNTKTASCSQPQLSEDVFDASTYHTQDNNQCSNHITQLKTNNQDNVPDSPAAAADDDDQESQDFMLHLTQSQSDSQPLIAEPVASPTTSDSMDLLPQPVASPTTSDSMDLLPRPVASPTTSDSMDLLPQPVASPTTSGSMDLLPRPVASPTTSDSMDLLPQPVASPTTSDSMDLLPRPVASPTTSDSMDLLPQPVASPTTSGSMDLLPRPVASPTTSGSMDLLPQPVASPTTSGSMDLLPDTKISSTITTTTKPLPINTHATTSSVPPSETTLDQVLLPLGSLLKKQEYTKPNDNAMFYKSLTQHTVSDKEPTAPLLLSELSTESGSGFHFSLPTNTEPLRPVTCTTPPPVRTWQPAVPTAVSQTPGISTPALLDTATSSCQLPPTPSLTFSMPRQESPASDSENSEMPFQMDKPSSSTSSKMSTTTRPAQMSVFARARKDAKRPRREIQKSDEEHNPFSLSSQDEAVGPPVSKRKKTQKSTVEVMSKSTTLVTEPQSSASVEPSSYVKTTKIRTIKTVTTVVKRIISIETTKEGSEQVIETLSYEEEDDPIIDSKEEEKTTVERFVETENCTYVRQPPRAPVSTVELPRTSPRRKRRKDSDDQPSDAKKPANVENRSNLSKSSEEIEKEKCSSEVSTVVVTSPPRLQRQTTETVVEDQSTSKTPSAERHLTPGMRVFARWSDNFYYPGVLTNKVGSSGRCYNVLFDDGDKRKVHSDQLIARDSLHVGQSVLAQDPDGFYDPGTIVGNFRSGSDRGYEIEITSRKKRQLYLEQRVILSDEQAKTIVHTSSSSSRATSGSDQGDKTKSLRSSSSNISTGELTKSRDTSAKDTSCSSNELFREQPHTSPQIPTRATKDDEETPKSYRKVRRLRHLSRLRRGGRAESSSEGSSEEQLKKQGKRAKRGLMKKLNVPTRTSPRKTAQIATRESSDLGPLPSNDSLFAGFAFLITGCCNTQKDVSTDSESEQVEFDRAHLVVQIETGGGVVLTNVQETQDSSADQCFLISNTYQRTAKYFQCLSYNLPLVHHMWVYDCCVLNRLQDYKNYLLPTGRSLETGQVIECSRATRPKILHGLNIYLQGKADFKTTWSSVVLAAGSHVVTKLPNRPGRAVQLHNSDVCHVVISETKQLPQSLQYTCKMLAIPIVGLEWLFQCLINGYIVAYNGHPKYDYKNIDIQDIT